MMTETNIRQYEVQAQSTNTFGRVLCSARNHHFVVDGPVQNDCPGEEITPGELFLAGVAACGVELIQVLARQQNLSLAAAHVTISGVLDRSQPVRPDVTLFNSVRLEFHFKGVSQEQGVHLVETFKGR
jgi:organic hydroperoxide reductase OsmC/OhrA